MKRLFKFMSLIPSLLRGIWGLVKESWEDSCVHEWKEVREVFTQEFLGELILQTWTPMKVCVKCGKVVMESSFLGGEPGIWIPLTPLEKEILMEKVVDRGDYFELRVPASGREGMMFVQKEEEIEDDDD